MPDAAGHNSDFGPAGHALMTACKVVAVAGGLVFVALVAMSIVSIVGRKLWSVPVPGDLELMQMGAAVGSSAFFAYCHLVRGDVKVDFFTQHWKASRVALLDAIGSLLVGLFGALISWRTAVGAISLFGDGETSAILGWPIWLAQALMLPGFVLLAAAGLYMSWFFLGKARSGSLA
jgi:TRAP-type mannitol/chloroaromatic compound transport system permease small subunit